ncbi:MAG: hypothetical protein ACYTKD_03700 [Planctomycetota bacterium]|jgi:hypothetical protein
MNDAGRAALDFRALPMVRAGHALLLGCLAAACLTPPAGAMAGETWFDALLAKRAAVRASRPAPAPLPLPDMGKRACTVLAWVRTTGDGSIIAKTAPEGPWVRHGKALFIRGGRLAYDVG